MSRAKCQNCGYKWQSISEIDAVVGMCPRCGNKSISYKAVDDDSPNLYGAKHKPEILFTPDSSDGKYLLTEPVNDEKNKDQQLSDLRKIIESHYSNSEQAEAEFGKYSLHIRKTEMSSDTHISTNRKHKFLKESVFWMPVRLIEENAIQAIKDFHEWLKNAVPDPNELGAEGKALGKLVNSLGFTTRERIVMAIYFIVCGLMAITIAAFHGEITIIFQ